VDGLIIVSLVSLWCLVIVDLVITLKIFGWVNERNEMRRRFIETTELEVGHRAPDFAAVNLDGDPVKSPDYSGQRVAFIFVSPFCASCRDEIPEIVRLAPMAMRNARVQFVFVTDATARENRVWLDTIRSEDGVDITIPVLAAPSQNSSFFEQYNPGGMLPYFCLLDADGVVEARSLLVDRAWTVQKRAWEGTGRLAPWMAP
jgi:hypothetical protein